MLWGVDSYGHVSKAYKFYYQSINLDFLLLKHRAEKNSTCYCHLLQENNSYYERGDTLNTCDLVQLQFRSTAT